MINENEIAILHAGFQCMWSPRAFQAAINTTREWVDSDIDEWWLGATAPGVGKGYRQYRSRIRYLERVTPDQIECIEIVRLAPGGLNPLTEWSALSIQSRKSARCTVGSVPSIVGRLTRRISDDFRAMMQTTSSLYGFLFRQHMMLGPMLYSGGGNLYIRDDPRPQDGTMNNSWWGHTVSLQRTFFAHGLLRDAFPESYLSQPYLDARLGTSRTTLKQWIEADHSARGTLEPYTDLLTKWTPPVEKIPQIREELFRAGRVFYWQCFCPPSPGQKPDRFFRPDHSAPWVAPDPIPEIYRADYWKDKDPGLTY